MNIRAATLEDLPQLLDSEQQVLAYERPFNAALKTEDTCYYDLPHLISDSQSLLLVADVDGEIVGTGYVQIRTSKPSRKHQAHGYMGFMYVSPAYRGQGINQQIITTLLNWGQAQGVTDFYLDVYTKNKSAIRAYQKVGFESNMTEMKLSLE